MHENPWKGDIAELIKATRDLSNIKDVILPKDKSELLKNKEIRCDWLPEPFCGNPKAPIYLLNLNPGYDELWQLKPAREEMALISRLRDHIICNMTFYKGYQNKCDHEFAKFPFYNLDPTYRNLPGFRWWYNKLSKILSALNNTSIDKMTGKELRTVLRKVSNSVFDVEFFPYHSKNFRWERRRVESQLFNIDLVRQAVEKGKTIVVMKGCKIWTGENVVRELNSYDMAFKMRSNRNSQISENNLRSLDERKDPSSDDIFKKLVKIIQDFNRDLNH